MNNTDSQKVEVEYNKVMGQITELYKEREKIKSKIIDVPDLLNYNDLLSEIRYLVVKAEYKARELCMYYTNQVVVKNAETMVKCMKEKMQSTYAKEYAKIEAKEFQTFADFYEIKWKRLRDESEVLKDDTYSKKTRIKFLMMDEQE